MTEAQRSEQFRCDLMKMKPRLSPREETVAMGVFRVTMAASERFASPRDCAYAVRGVGASLVEKGVVSQAEYDSARANVKAVVLGWGGTYA